MYKPPYTITDKILSHVGMIAEKSDKLVMHDIGDNRPHLRKNSRISSIYSSLRIEANSLALGQVRDVIDGHHVIGEKREIQEVKNAYTAYEELMTLDPYNLHELKRIHGIMTKYLINESGEFRRGEEGVFAGDKCIFMAPPAKFVPSQMQELFEWMRNARETVHPLIISSVFHYEFVFIHPFADGNGRIARLWHTAILAKWKSIFEYIPIETQLEKCQEQYYDAISTCHVAGESTQFIEFMLTQINTILDEFAADISKYDITSDVALANLEVSDLVKKLIRIMEIGVAYTSNELMEKLSLKSKEGFRRNYLKPAIEAGLVQMTEPDKPNSRNQKYKLR